MRCTHFNESLCRVGRMAGLLFAILATPSLAPGQDEIPSWQTGTSTWSGNGYSTSTAPTTPAVQAPAPSDTGPSIGYTVPTDPTLHVNPYVTNEPVASGFSELNFDDLKASDFYSPDLPGAPRVAMAPQTESPKTQHTDATELRAPENAPASEAPAEQLVEELPAPPGEPESVLTPEPDIVEYSDGAPAAAMTNQFPTAELSEPAPLDQAVTRWYQYPARWMRGWDSSAEFGLDGSSGNADTLAMQTGLELKRKTENYTFSVDIDYRLASSNSATTEDNGRANVDIDRLFQDSPWATFGKFGLEFDKFKAFDLRLNVNGGLGYHWVRTDDATFVTRFGAGASKEIGAPDDDWVAEAVFGMEAEKQIDARHKVKAKLDYFPAWEDFNDYRLVADASWEILLDDTDNFSLKLAVTDRYDSTPQGAKENDVYYSMLLLYKF